jgi:hypothetical protein
MKMKHDMVKIHSDKKKVLCIDKEDAELSELVLHEQCGCDTNTIVSKYYDEHHNLLFQSKKKKNTWYVVKKSVISFIVRKDHCHNIYPCRNYKGKIQENGFAWIISDNLSTLETIKEKCDQVYNKINRHGENRITRDYEKSMIGQCSKNKCINNSFTGYIDDFNKDIYYGFTGPNIPKNSQFYILGVVQQPNPNNKRHNKTHFNAAGGKTEMIWDDNNKSFEVEKISDAVIREMWEELGLEFSDQLFETSILRSFDANINGYRSSDCKTVVVYNLFVPDKLQFEQKFWNDDEQARYVVTIENEN